MRYVVIAVLLVMLGAAVAKERAASDHPETSAAELLEKAVEARNKRNFDKAAEWYLKAAEAGNAEARNSLGFLYDHGVGVEKDPAEAAKWYKLAARQGHLQAQNNLGLMYVQGAGVPQSDAEAVKWFSRSAQAGYDEGQLNYAFAWYKGKGGLPADKPEAYKWLFLASRQGNKNAEKILAKVSKSMTDDEITEGRNRAETWQAKH